MDQLATLTEAELAPRLQRLRTNLGKAIRGKSEVIDQVIVALLAGGSVLIEDVPGVGKTTLAKALATATDLDFQRVQCTPDLLPADIFGFSVFHPQQGSFDFRRGPIFTNILLVDEINRASPRTQSALLEAMAEHQVTTEGERFDLPKPFLVLATQNPLGFQGTFALPEAQLDRFLFRLALDYPDAESEVTMLYDHMHYNLMHGAPSATDPAPVLSRTEILQAQAMAQSVQVQQCVARYMVELVRRTRQDPRIRLGCSPRGSLMLCRAAQALALLRGRTYLLPDDVQEIAPLVLAHRLVLGGEGLGSSAHQRSLVDELIRQIAVPV